jgi:hypothetical protein
LFAGNFFDGFEGHRHGEDLLNLGFTDVQHHSAALREYVDSSRVLENSVRLPPACLLSTPIVDAGAVKAAAKPPHSKKFHGLAGRTRGVSEI